MVKNMTNTKGNKVPNQFIIEGYFEIELPSKEKKVYNGIMFQSYRNNIVFKASGKIFLDSYYWNYSKTTGKYRNQFLGETTKETEHKIKSGVYTFCNLNLY